MERNILLKVEKRLREEIFKKITQICRERKRQERFVAGKTRINYAGRVYDEKEMINLVDASLDFSLTAGRYALEFEKAANKKPDSVIGKPNT